MFLKYRVILLNLAVLLLASVVSADKPWNVYRQKAHCSISRQGWLSIAQDPPGYGWMLCNGSTTSFTFAAAAAEMDFLKMSQCQGELPNCPRFKSDCCLFNVYLNTQTGVFSVIAQGSNPGPGHMIFKSSLCCEDAALEAGLPSLGCTQLDLVSVPGVRVQLTNTGWVSLMGPVTIPSNPPLVVPSLSSTPQNKQDPPVVITQNEDDPGWIFDDGEDGWIEKGEIEDGGGGEIEDGGGGEIEDGGGEIEDGTGEGGITKPPAQDIDLSGTWSADRSPQAGPGKLVMTLKRKNEYQYEGSWEIVAPGASAADRHQVTVEVSRPGEGRLILPFYVYDMTYSENQIDAGDIYRRQ